MNPISFKRHRFPPDVIRYAAQRDELHKDFN